MLTREEILVILSHVEWADTENGDTIEQVDLCCSAINKLREMAGIVPRLHIVNDGTSYYIDGEFGIGDVLTVKH